MAISSTAVQERSILRGSPLMSSFAVKDLDAARTFYRDTLGLDVRDDTDMGIFEIHGAGETSVMVYPKPDHQPAVFTILNFPVKDIESTVNHLMDGWRHDGALRHPGRPEDRPQGHRPRRQRSRDRVVHRPVREHPLRAREQPLVSTAGATSEASPGRPRYDAPMIKAVHALIYSDDPEATRSFLRDVLGWPSVEDAHSVPPLADLQDRPERDGCPPDIRRRGRRGVLVAAAPLDLADVRRHRGHEGPARGEGRGLHRRHRGPSASAWPRTSNSLAPARSSSTSRGTPRRTTSSDPELDSLLAP